MTTPQATELIKETVTCVKVVRTKYLGENFRRTTATGPWINIGAMLQGGQEGSQEVGERQEK